MFDRPISQIKQQVRDIIDGEYGALLGLPSTFDYPKKFLFNLSSKIFSINWSYDKDEYNEGDCHYFWFKDQQNNIKENLTIDYDNNSWTDIVIDYTRYCGDDKQYIRIIKTKWEFEKYGTISRCRLDGENDMTADFICYGWTRQNGSPSIEYHIKMKERCQVSQETTISRGTTKTVKQNQVNTESYDPDWYHNPEDDAELIRNIEALFAANRKK